MANLPPIARIYSRDRWKFKIPLTEYEDMRVELAVEAIEAYKSYAEEKGKEWGPEMQTESGQPVYMEIGQKLHMMPADIYTLIVSP